MMPAPSDRPLERVTLNLFADDVAYLRRTSDKWTEEVRDIITEHVKADRQLTEAVRSLFNGN